MSEESVVELLPKEDKPKSHGKKKKKSAEQLFLKQRGIVRPKTDFMMWREAISEQLKKDVESGSPPAERLAAFEKCSSKTVDSAQEPTVRVNFNTYCSVLWKEFVEEDEKLVWKQKYDLAKEEWQQQKAAALKDMPKRPPKRPPTAYFLFYKDFYRTQAKENEPLPQVARRAALVWKEKSASEEFKHYHEESERFQKQYNDEKAEHEAEAIAVKSKTEEDEKVPNISEKTKRQADSEPFSKEKNLSFKKKRRVIKTANKNAI